MKPIRIVSICTGAHETNPRAFGLALREAERLVREAGRGQPDLIVLPELFAHAVFPVKQWAQAAEDLRGETCARFGRLARQLGAVIVCPLLERVGDRVYSRLNEMCTFVRVDPGMDARKDRQGSGSFWNG